MLIPIDLLKNYIQKDHSTVTLKQTQGNALLGHFTNIKKFNRFKT